MACGRKAKGDVMTLAMPDSIHVADLPDGYPAYLGYADGDFATAGELAARFPHAHRIILTVTGATLDADGCDIERGDLSPENGANWIQRKLAENPPSRPVAYASVSRMPDVIAALGTRGIKRGQVRLLSAHYSPFYREHICGPASCAWPGVPEMDGTQWTNNYPGLNGSRVDMSVLGDGFFGLSWTEKLVQELPVVRMGDRGEAVKTVQALCNARAPHPVLSIDGIFGEQTDTAVRFEQHKAGFPPPEVDGVVGRLTWPVLLALT